MVKVYYSYEFDKVVGVVASSQCNFAIDRKRMFRARQASWWCRGAASTWW